MQALDLGKKGGVRAFYIISTLEQATVVMNAFHDLSIVKALKIYIYCNFNVY